MAGEKTTQRKASPKKTPARTNASTAARKQIKKKETRTRESEKPQERHALDELNKAEKQLLSIMSEEDAGKVYAEAHARIQTRADAGEEVTEKLVKEVLAQTVGDLKKKGEITIKPVSSGKNKGQERTQKHIAPVVSKAAMSMFEERPAKQEEGETPAKQENAQNEAPIPARMEDVFQDFTSLIGSTLFIQSENPQSLKEKLVKLMKEAPVQEQLGRIKGLTGPYYVSTALAAVSTVTSIVLLYPDTAKYIIERLPGDWGVIAWAATVGTATGIALVEWARSIVSGVKRIRAFRKLNELREQGERLAQKLEENCFHLVGEPESDKGDKE